MKITDISKGDKVVVNNSMSGIVDAVHAGIKNGLPGIDYTTDDKKPMFCYLSQITSHTKKEKTSKVKMLEKTIHRPRFEDLAVGDNIIVSMAGASNRKGVIEETNEEIKNGMSGVGFNDEKEGCWCYTDQIISVTKMVPEKTVKVSKKPRI